MPVLYGGEVIQACGVCGAGGDELRRRLARNGRGGMEAACHRVPTGAKRSGRRQFGTAASVLLHDRARVRTRAHVGHRWGRGKTAGHVVGQQLGIQNQVDFFESPWTGRT